MTKTYNKTISRAVSVLLSLILALTMLLPALAGTSANPTALSLGENQVTLGTVYADSYYTYTPSETGDYIIRSVSSAPSDPYMEYNFTSYLDYNGSTDFSCTVSMTAGTTYRFNIRDAIDDSPVVIVVEKAPEVLPNALSLGDNALSLNRKAYAEEYSFTPSETGVYEFSSSGYGQPGCIWGDDDYGAEGMVGETYSWQFRFEKELTAGTGYVFTPYNQSGAYEGTVTITKKSSSTVTIDAVTLGFVSGPALGVSIGDAAVTVPADAHYSVACTWTNHNGVELTDDDIFRCGMYYLAATVTPDDNYQFADDAVVTFTGANFIVDLLAARSMNGNAVFDFGDAHTYSAWEEMSNIQIAEAGFGEPYEGKVWEYRVCEDCGKTQYRGGDCPEISSIILAFSNVPTAGLDLNDIDFTVPYGQPLTMATGEGTGWIGNFAEGSIRFLCNSGTYTAFTYLYPTAGHTITADNDLEILVECSPADAVIDTDYAFLSGLEGIYAQVEFREVEHVYTGPVWRWADDYSEAYADFACVNGDWTVTATVHNPVMSEVSPATYLLDQVIKYTAHTEFRGVQYEQESGNVTVTGTAAALLAADTAAFNAYKAEKAAALDALAKDGDSDASAALIADAKAEITALSYDESKTLEENKSAADAKKETVAALLSDSLTEQRAAEAAAAQLAADKAEFEDYKAAKAAELDALAQDGDSAASKALIDDAKAAVAALTYDESKTLEENKATANTDIQAITAQLSADLTAQREADAQSPQEKPDDPQDEPRQEESAFRRFLNRIRDFFRRIAEFFRNLFKR